MALSEETIRQQLEAARQRAKLGSLWYHRNTKKFYLAENVAMDVVTGLPVVHYSRNGLHFVRELEDFLERFSQDDPGATHL